MAIQGFKSKALRRFSEKQDARKLPAQHIRRIADILDILGMADPLPLLREDEKYRLHPLVGGILLSTTVKASGAFAFPCVGA